MFRHVVMFKWADHVDASHIDNVAAQLNALADKIDVIRSYRHGPDAGVNEGNYDYAVVADFDSVGDYERYRAHPDHRAFVVAMITGSAETRAAVQYHLAE